MSDIPKTCKAAVLVEYGQPLEIRRWTSPRSSRGAILVKVEMAGICGTDVHQQKGELTIKSPLPNIQGHETIGRIVKLGEGRVIDAAGEPLKVGDRIMWAHADCGECYWCQIERDPVLCAKRSGLRLGPARRAPGRLRRVRVRHAHDQRREGARRTDRRGGGRGRLRLPDRSSLATSALARWGSWRTSSSRAAGPSGSTPRWSRARAVPATSSWWERPQNRLELAKRWGADHVINIDEVQDRRRTQRDHPRTYQGQGPGECGRSVRRAGHGSRRPGHDPEGWQVPHPRVRASAAATTHHRQPHQREGAHHRGQRLGRTSSTSTRPCSSSRHTAAGIPSARS